MLDLGSSSGTDVFCAAVQVGPSGRVVGVDFTDEHIEKSVRSRDRDGFAQVDFAEPVLTALFEYRDGRGRLLAVWRDREARDRYLAETPVPHGTKLFRDLGLEPEIETFDVLELG